MADHPDKGQQAPISCLSILIPVYNEVRTLEVLLRRVMAAPLPCAREVVVVDDGSTDGSAAVLDRLAREYPEITLLRNEQNAGKRRGHPQSHRRDAWRLGDYSGCGSRICAGGLPGHAGPGA